MTQNIASLARLKNEGKNIDRLPFSIRILLENALRNHDGFGITDEHLQTLINWDPKGVDREIPFKPARVLMQDFTGVPAVVDIASIRGEVIRKGKDGTKIKPAIPVDLVIDHSVQVDYFGTNYAYAKNVELEYERNSERYKLLKWAQKGLDNFNVVPPGMGICHQVNLEYLASVVIERDGWLFPDTLVGTDSHTPMVNGLSVLGWGVGGIEAEAALLGQPIYFTCPEVIGLKFTGKLQVGVTATDMVLATTELLRKYGVVGKFVELFGEGLDTLTVPDRATISNMSPEFGCTATYFPIDAQTLGYLERTHRKPEHIALVEAYAKENMLWRTGNEQIQFSDVIELNLSGIEPAVAGPKRPQDRILVRELHEKFGTLLEMEYQRKYIPINERRETAWLSEGGSGTTFNYRDNDSELTATVQTTAVKHANFRSVHVSVMNEEFVLSDGAVVIAAITSCTNTSNPSVMIGAGLVAKKAVEMGLMVKPWVKTSLAPGSKVVTQYLQRAGLLDELDALHFHIVGYGCTTCIGNSGPLPAHIAEAVEKGDLVASAVLSGNRNFEARVHPQVRMNFLASPMLVVAYALAGRVDIDLNTEALGFDPNGHPVMLKDIWPSPEEINDTLLQALSPNDYRDTYDVIYEGEEQWKSLVAPTGQEYIWEADSTYIHEAPFFKDISAQALPVQNILKARVLLMLGDSVTTDHISPAGSFREDSPAGQYLRSKGIEKADFNSYGSRRGNDEVMIRGTFANVRIKNQVAQREGGYTTHFPGGESMSVYDAAMRYKEEGVPLVILAGKEYGSGSSRDWAAKGTFLLGVKAVIAESFERIHRSNLVGMGVLPLLFSNGQNAASLGLTGHEVFDIEGIASAPSGDASAAESGGNPGVGLLKPGQTLKVKATPESGGDPIIFETRSRLDSAIEIEYYRHGGILQYVLRDFLKKA